MSAGIGPRSRLTASATPGSRSAAGRDAGCTRIDESCVYRNSAWKREVIANHPLSTSPPGPKNVLSACMAGNHDHCLGNCLCECHVPDEGEEQS